MYVCVYVCVPDSPTPVLYGYSYSTDRVMVPNVSVALSISSRLWVVYPERATTVLVLLG